jgi:hypothetical protein
MADVLPLPALMRLVKGRKAAKEEPRNEEMFRFPVIQETWEVWCGSHDDRGERTPRRTKADSKAGLYDIAS